MPEDKSSLLPAERKSAANCFASSTLTTADQAGAEAHVSSDKTSPFERCLNMSLKLILAVDVFILCKKYSFRQASENLF